MNVTHFVAAVAAEPFAWSHTDCASIADRWVQTVRGFSPMERFGRRHQSKAEALAWLAEPGDLTVAFNRVMRANGFKRTKEPKPGDLGLVIFDKRMCIAIHAGDCWFSRHEDGLIAAPLDKFWKAWSV